MCGDLIGLGSEYECPNCKSMCDIVGDAKFFDIYPQIKRIKSTKMQEIAFAIIIISVLLPILNLIFLLIKKLMQFLQFFLSII